MCLVNCYSSENTLKEYSSPEHSQHSLLLPSLMDNNLSHFHQLALRVEESVYSTASNKALNHFTLTFSQPYCHTLTLSFIPMYVLYSLFEKEDYLQQIGRKMYTLKAKGKLKRGN